jgi:putative transposase
MRGGFGRVWGEEDDSSLRSEGVQKALVEVKYGMNKATQRRVYPTDLTDEQWAKVEPLLPRVKPTGRPPIYSKRELLNAMLYTLRTGCSWRMLPHDLPPFRSVHWYFSLLRDCGFFEQLNEALRTEYRVSIHRNPDPSIVVIDAQDVKTTEKGGSSGTKGGTTPRR